MSKYTKNPWLPRLCFRLCLTIAASLILLVYLSPVLELGIFGVGQCPRALALFAHDSLIRRTAVTSGFGLFVTGFVFFRPQWKSRTAKSGQVNIPPPNNVMGA
jgi:hypothetical protein